jgi:hypothetical protein
VIPTILVKKFGPDVAKLIFWLTIAVLVVAVLGVAKCSYDQRAQTEVKLAKDQAGAALQSGQDAVNTVGNRMDADAQGDALTRSSAATIDNAEGAKAPVAAPVRDAGIAALCRRAAYRDTPRCKGAK